MKTEDPVMSNSSPYRFPFHGWVGVLILLKGFILVIFTTGWFIHTYFTPWMWTGYLLAADALLARLRGRSWLWPEPSRFLFLLPVSLALWLWFEFYNLHLRNWSYIGLPESGLLALFGYAWSFVTIWPALFITADLLEAFGLRAGISPLRVSRRMLTGLLISGSIMALAPLLLPAHLAAYTFVIVWIAYVPLCEPFAYGSRKPEGEKGSGVQEEVHSLLRDLEEGILTRWLSLGIGGLVCGFLWESWNMVATAKWVYIFPLFQNMKLFEMPLPGYLGFIPFAWEAWSMYAVILLFGRKLWPSLPGPPPFSNPVTA